MKKKLIMAIGIIVAIGILGIGLFFSSTKQLEPSLTSGEIKDLVHDQYPGEIKEQTLKTVANRPIYEVDINDDNKTYKLELDGNSGEVINIQKEDIQVADEETKKPSKKKKEDKHNDKTDEKKASEDTQEKQTVISPEKAAEIALEQFSGEIDEIELEEEDGRLIYEVEIERGEQEAEIEIDAYTGEVIVIEIDED